jgi:hypothetical protein
MEDRCNEASYQPIVPGSRLFIKTAIETTYPPKKKYLPMIFCTPIWSLPGCLDDTPFV